MSKWICPSCHKSSCVGCEPDPWFESRQTVMTDTQEGEAFIQAEIADGEWEKGYKAAQDQWRNACALAAEQIDSLTRQLAEAREALNRLWVCMEKIDRTDPETVAWIESTHGMDLRKRSFRAMSQTAAQGTTELMKAPDDWIMNTLYRIREASIDGQNGSASYALDRLRLIHEIAEIAIRKLDPLKPEVNHEPHNGH